MSEEQQGRPVIPHRSGGGQRVVPFDMPLPNGTAPFHFTNAEKAAAYEWLRGQSLSALPHWRHAAIMLTEVSHLVRHTLDYVAKELGGELAPRILGFDERAIAQAASSPVIVHPRVTHLLCFAGEGAQAILCYGWEDCRAKFFDGIMGPGPEDRDEEQVKAWDRDFLNKDNWSTDEDGAAFCFTSDIGETSRVRIYVVREASEPNADHAPATQLRWLENLLTHCPHAELRYIDDDDNGDGPVGFSLWVDGCSTLDLQAPTLAALIELGMKAKPDEDGDVIATAPPAEPAPRGRIDAERVGRIARAFFGTPRYVELCTFAINKALREADLLLAPHGTWQPIDTAPKDGTLVLLLIRADDARKHPLEDTGEASRTIGHNNFKNDGEDRWQFAGWCWEHDHYAEGEGVPTHWLQLRGAHHG